MKWVKYSLPGAQPAYAATPRGVRVAITVTRDSDRVWRARWSGGMGGYRGVTRDSAARALIAASLAGWAGSDGRRYATPYGAA